ncbi:hypothetical protein SAMN04489727_1729 [Amycolatopsis tolypomycina]|uniref:Uncharacterized protein n=1 Tax=Amycolatopsis tolypomycina TaxID=208445 RepID=A0A1H4JC20_9PSEU|nr:hypothetical protein [Amycolatopsis tolypomycina]SEB43625.1 hypothetical protein SAMN04489727_1729 [Amycolatopsis tolypomycina]
MKIIYTPADGDEQTWDWDPKLVRARDAELIEGRADATWDEFQMQLLAGRMRARRVLLWFLLRKDHPTLRLDDVDFAAGEMKAEHTVDELVELREGLEDAPNIPDDRREAARDFLDQRIAKLREDGEEPAGKARSKPSAKSSAS